MYLLFYILLIKSIKSNLKSTTMNGMDIDRSKSNSKRSHRSRSNAKSRQDGGSSKGNLSGRNSSQRFDGHPVILYERTENAD